MRRPASKLSIASFVIRSILICLALQLTWGFVLAQEGDVIAIALMSRGESEASFAGGEWKKIEMGDVFHNNDRIRTGGDGFVALAFTDDGGQIKLRPKTSVTLTADRLQSNAFWKRATVGIGELFVDVSRMKGALQVASPTSVATVKGTQFWTIVNKKGGTRIIILEGQVEVRSQITGERVQVGEGQYCDVSASGEMEVRQRPRNVRVPRWLSRRRQQEDLEAAEDTGQQSPGRDKGGGGGSGISMNGVVGATIINGEMYQFFSLRPDLPIWRFGVGLDLTFYFDSDGNLREADWDEPGDIIDKIYYLRYGKPGDPLFVRAGSLDEVTLGYGLVMRRYSNAIEWPQVRRIGLFTQLRRDKIGFEGVINNFRELGQPGVIGGRVTYEKKFALPVVFGATIVHDGNLYLGTKDDDGDGVPNPFDLFPGKDDEEHIDWLQNRLFPRQIDSLIASGDLPDINDPPLKVGDLKEEATVWCIDVGVPLVRKRVLSLWAYAQMARINRYGTGYTIPGFKFRAGPFRAGAEYRVFERRFLPEFFNLGYEIERVEWDDDAGDYLTKLSRLEDLGPARGYYVDAGFAFMSLVDIYAAYQQLNYPDDGGDTSSKSFYAQGSVNPGLIPKVGLAEAYYQQPQADNIFDTRANGTVLGYRVGVEMGSGLMVVVDKKTIYRNGEPYRIMTIETMFRF